jgi:ATP-dependent Clp protease ATP-binding subunit ClpB
LAEQLLAGRIKDGDTVKLTVRDGGLVVNGEPVKVAA